MSGCTLAHFSHQQQAFYNVAFYKCQIGLLLWCDKLRDFFDESPCTLNLCHKSSLSTFPHYDVLLLLEGRGVLGNVHITCHERQARTHTHTYAHTHTRTYTHTGASPHRPRLTTNLVQGMLMQLEGLLLHNALPGEL